MADETDVNINIGSDPSGVEQGTRRAKTAVNGVKSEADQLQAAFRRLKSSVDPSFAAQEKYNASMNEARTLFREGVINGREFGQLQSQLRARLQETTAALEQNSAAQREAAAAAKAAKAEAAASAKQSADEERAAARAAAAEAKQLRDQAKTEAKAARAEERAAIRQAAAEAKAAAREVAAAERAAKAEAKAAAKDAANAAKAEARAKTAAEKAASKEAADAEKAAKAEAKVAARQAAADAASAARESARAKKAEAAAAREAAEETRRMALAERQAAQAAHDLRASIDPVYASQMRYNQTMQTATQLLMQGKLRAGEFAAIQRQARTTMDVNTRSLGRQNTAYVQLGYQMQDVTASVASGINPLVILAQQGGQTAAALSTMGGTVGRVAAFMAGPWGAAILGFTLLIGFLAQRNDEAKKKTIDLMDAEARRKAGLGPLTDAINEFNKAQRESNTLEEESLRLKGVAVNQTIDETNKKLADANKRVTDLKAQLEAVLANPTEGSEGAVAVLGWQLDRAEKTVKALKGQLSSLQNTSQGELAITQSMRDAEAATDANTKAQQAYEREVSRVQNAFRRSWAESLKLTDADARAARQTQLKTMQTNLLTQAINRRKKAEEEAAEASRKTNPNGEGVSNFKSREQAIGIAGRELIAQKYRVSENVQFGGVKGGHNMASHGRNAIDVNIGSGLTEADDPGMRARIDETVRGYQARGYRILWNGQVYEPLMDGPGKRIPKGQNQHRDHFHIEAPGSIVGRPVGAGTSADIANQMREQAAAEKAARKDALDSLVEDYDYRKTLAENDYAEQVRLQNLKIKALQDYYGENSREAIRGQRELAQMEQRHNAEMLRMQRDRINAQAELDAMRLEDQKASAEAAISERGASTNFRQGAGVLSQRDALAERRATLDAQYAMERDFEDRLFQLRLKALRDQMALLPQGSDERSRVNNQIEEAELRHQITMNQIQRSQATDTAEINRQVAQATVDKYRQITDTISQGMSSTFQGMWMRSQSFMGGIINMADQLVFKFADMGFKMLTDWIASQLSMTAVTATQTAAQTGIVAAGETGKTAAVVTGAAIRTTAAVSADAVTTASSATSSIAQVAHSAAVAAAKVYASIAAIPVVGPFLAPAAAVGALAAVIALGKSIFSAEGGMGRVPYDGAMTELHKDEMVLPAWIASPLRDSLRGVGPQRYDAVGQVLGGRGSSDLPFPNAGRGGGEGPMAVTIHALDGRSVERVLKRNKRATSRGLRAIARDGYGN